jgi:hypothetical protein
VCAIAQSEALNAHELGRLDQMRACGQLCT